MSKKKAQSPAENITGQESPAPDASAHPIPENNGRKDLYLLGGALLLAAILTFVGIGKHYFWDDEANTAVVGQNMVKTMTASAWNGRNMLSYGMKGAVDADMKKSSVPPVQYVISGLAQKVLGPSTGGLRAVFAIFGLGAILFTALWYREEFDRKRWWLPAYFLALSVAYLLYIRQVRYYPLCLFFSCALLYLWARMPRAKYPWLVGGLALLSGALLAGTHYLFAGAIGLVIAVSMFRTRYHNKRSYILLGVFVGGTILASLVVIKYSPGTFWTAFNFSGDHMQRFAHWIGKGIKDASCFEFIPYGMLFFAAIGLFIKDSAHLKQLGRDYFFIWLYMLTMLIGCSFFSPQPGLGKVTDMRYYIDLIPMAAVAVALTWEILAETKQRWLPWTFGILLISSNLLYLNFPLEKYDLTCRLGRYIRENTSPYPSTGQAIEEYISKNIDKDQCVFMVPMYNNIIQMFYHPEQKFCGLVSNTAAFAKKHKDELREDLFFETAIPDFFLVGNRDPQKFKALLDYLYGPDTYQLHDALPVFWNEATRPEIPWRFFEPIQITNPLYGGVLVYTRTNAPAHYPKISGRQIERYIKF